MGIISDYYEVICADPNFDQIIFGSAYPSTKVYPTYTPFGDLPRIDNLEKLKEQKRLDEIKKQFSRLYSLKENIEAFRKASVLLSRCTKQEKDLFWIKRKCRFSTPLVINAVDEFLRILSASIEYGAKQISEIRDYVDSLPELAQCNDVDSNIGVTLATLIDCVLVHLAEGTIDDPHYIHDVFSDLSQLILLINPEMNGKRPKEICDSYFVSVYHPKTGIYTCENCHQLLYKDFPYCFHCFERSTIS